MVDRGLGLRVLAFRVVEGWVQVCGPPLERLSM